MTVLVSNAAEAALTVWIEPWCDELTLPTRAVLMLDAPAGNGKVAELEVVEDRLVVWAMAPGTLLVSIDGVEQDTGSRTIALPAEMFSLSVKRFVNRFSMVNRAHAWQARHLTNVPGGYGLR